MPELKPTEYLRYPNARAMVKDLLPVVVAVLVGFDSAVLAVSLDQDLINPTVWFFTPRDVLLLGGSASLLFFILCLVNCMYYRAVDFGDIDESWYGKEAKQRAEEWCKSQRIHHGNRALLWFYLGLACLTWGFALALIGVFWVATVLLVAASVWPLRALCAYARSERASV